MLYSLIISAEAPRYASVSLSIQSHSELQDVCFVSFGFNLCDHVQILLIADRNGLEGSENNDTV